MMKKPEMINYEIISKEIRKDRKTGKNKVIYIRIKCPNCGKIERIYLDDKSKRKT